MAQISHKRAGNSANPSDTTDQEDLAEKYDYRKLHIHPVSAKEFVPQDALADPASRAALQQAEVLFLKGQYPEAETVFVRLLQQAPHHPGLNLRLGEIWYRQGRLEDAAKALSAAAPYRPQDAKLHNTLGYIFLRRDLPEEARKHFLRALGIEPDYFESWMGLGTCNRAAGQMRQALHSFERAVAARPKAAEAWNNLGVAANAVQDPHRAREAFDRAITLKPDYARAHAGRASTLLMLGHAADAEKEATQAMALAPDDVEIFYILSTIRHFQAGDPDLQRMTDYAESHAKSGQACSALHFALAKGWDDCHQITRAFAHMQKANATQRAIISYNEAAHIEEMRQLGRMVPPPAHQAQSSALPVFIVGMPRTGSSLLEQMLDCHPEISGTGERADFGICAAGGYGPGMAMHLPPDPAQTGAAYLARMRPLAPKAKRIIDKRLDNFRFLGTIATALPGAHIIHMRRDPEDVALSCFCTRFNGPVGFAYDLAELGRYYRACEELMAHWREVLPENRLMDVRYEDLVMQPEATLRRVLDFLGLEWDPACLSFTRNPRPVQTASAAAVRQPLYNRAIGRAAAYQAQLAPFRAAFRGA